MPYWKKKHTHTTNKPLVILIDQKRAAERKKKQIAFIQCMMIVHNVYEPNA